MTLLKGRDVVSIQSTWTARRRSACVAAGAALLSGTSHAASLGCVDEAAARFGVPAPVMQSIVELETSGRCHARHPTNRNGSYDIGCAGINSTWLPTLDRRFGITEQALRDPCTNIHVGAWILAHNFRQHGNTWRGVGAYNAASEPNCREYAWKVVTHMRFSGR